jgi:hypothetical protein
MIVATCKHNRCDNHARVIQETLREDRRHSDRSPARDGATESLCTFPPPSRKALSQAHNLYRPHGEISQGPTTTKDLNRISTTHCTVKKHTETQFLFLFEKGTLNNLPIIYINSLSVWAWTAMARTDWARARTNWTQTEHERAGHGRIVFEHHEYQLVIQ